VSIVLSGTGTAPSEIAPRNADTKSLVSSMHIATRCSGSIPRSRRAPADLDARSAI
jgi:hypothetical protein